MLGMQCKFSWKATNDYRFTFGDIYFPLARKIVENCVRQIILHIFDLECRNIS